MAELRDLPSRRGLLGLAVAACAAVTAGCSSTKTAAARSAGSSAGSAPTGASDGSPAGSAGSSVGSSVTPRRIAYGSDRSQYGDLYQPSGPRRRGTIVVIHGGFWQSTYSSSLGAPLAADLARRGWASWNLEYRRIGGGGGWPMTFDDVAAGIDVLGAPAFSDAGLDLDRVVVIGHSAGGQLAVWAAARPGLPAGAPGHAPKVRVHGVVSQAGVLDLIRADQTALGGTSTRELMGGSSSAVPDRYALGSPIARVPIGVPVRCVHSPDDGIVPLEQSQRYVAAATRAGDDAALIRTTGDHFALITVGSAAWNATLGQLPGLVG